MSPVPRVRPRHAWPSLLVAIRWTALANWTTVLALAVVGSLFAFGQGRALRADAAIPPPEPEAVARFVPFTNSIDTVVPLPTLQPSQPQPSVTTAKVPAAAEALAANGIPFVALRAYQQAAARAAALQPACGVGWQLLAAIGRVESNHGRFGGAQLRTDGSSTQPILGIPLNGNGTALIRDTDGGRLDTDPVFDRAVGPMQFIPSTWAAYGVDANGDGRADPFNIFDATAAAADYLCRAGGDLTTVAGKTRAVYAYNHSSEYVALVLAIEAVYLGQPPHVTYPVVPPKPPAVPPVDPGTPLGVTTPPTASPTPTPSTSASTSPSTPTGTSSTATDTASPSPSSDASCSTTSVSATPSAGETLPTADPCASSSAPASSPISSEPGMPTATDMTG